jgi:hypothetical protein
MATKRPDEQDAAQEKQAGRQQDAAVGRHVLHALGEPRNLQRVQVRRLWEDSYRVNIFIGPDAASARIAHSYFLVADGDGNITQSTPTLTRQYGPRGAENLLPSP